MRRVLLSLICIIAATTTLSAQKIVAHRGHHSAEGAAQNAISSLIAADEASIEVVEFDVVMTADNHLVVAHGPNHPADNNMRIGDTTLDTLRTTPLPNGETLPTLDEYLDVAMRYPNIHMLVEIKIWGDEDVEACFNAIEDAIAERGLSERATYISFSRKICDLAAEHGAMYLAGDLSPKRVAKRGYKGISYPTVILRLHPAWIRRAHNLGLEVSIWTVNNRKDAEWAIRHNVDYITTDNPALISECIANK